MSAGGAERGAGSGSGRGSGSGTGAEDEPTAHAEPDQPWHGPTSVAGS